jgi:hypothetical protein
MNCQELFNIARDGLGQIWTPTIVGAALVAFAAICLAVMYRSEHVWFAWVLLVVTVLLTIVSALLPLTTFVKFRRALANGEYATVEGRVDHFLPMPAGGHEPERFTISGESFSYTDFSASPFFHHTATNGGPIQQGAYLKIAHVDGKILRLELCTKEPTRY